MKHKKIVLYGTGVKTEAVIKHAVDFNIAGLMDSSKTGKVIFGCQVLSPEEIVDKKIDFIVLLSSPTSFKIIYRRIKEFCSQFQIPVFDYKGNDLSFIYQEFKDTNQYFSKNRKLLEHQIIAHELIIYDFFEVLAMHNLYELTDFYYLMDKIVHNRFPGLDFFRARTEAENYLKNVGYSPGMNQIYAEIQKKYLLPDSEIQFFIDLEIKLLELVIKPRTLMVDSLRYAIEQGKDIMITIDSCMSADVIKTIFSMIHIPYLNTNNITIESGKNKIEMLRTIKEACGDRTYLYLGSQEKSLAAAKQLGYDTFSVLEARQMVCCSSLKGVLEYKKSIADSIALGLCTYNLFQNPFVLWNSNGKIKIHSAYDLGYSLIGPLVTGYMLWMAEAVKREHCDCILFPSRDGFLFQQLYELMVPYLDKEELLPSFYFLISRKVGYQAVLDTEQDLIEIIKRDFKGTPEVFLKERFDLKDSQIIPYQQEDLEEYILKHKKEIIHEAHINKAGLHAYMKSLGIQQYKKIAIFDFVAYGTSQKGLERIMASDLMGFYFMRMLNDNPQNIQLDIKSFYPAEYHSSADSNFYKNFVFLETIFTSDQPSLRSFCRDGTPIFYTEKRKKESFRVLYHIHDGIKAFFLDYLKLGGTVIEHKLNLQICDYILGMLCKEKSNFEDGILKGLSVYDDYEKRSFFAEDMI